LYIINHFPCLIMYEEPEEFVRRLEKKPRINPLFQNVHLLPDGTIKSEEALLVSIQRKWKESVYKPGGLMYRKTLKRFRNAAQLNDNVERCSEFSLG